MRFTNVGNFLQFDKWDDNLFPIGAGGGIEEEIYFTFQQSGISRNRLYNPDDNLRVDGSEALWIWAHGNRHRNCIAAGEDEIFSPLKLAKKLKKLNKASSGHVIVWSCYAGAVDGFVQHFAATMKGLGYDGLHFWGYKHITYGMERSDDGNQWADVFGEDPTIKFGGDLATSKLGANYGKSRAVRASMSGFGPGLSVAVTRPYEI